MKLIPLLFQPEMALATLEGRKTMTRRMRGLDTINKNPDDWQFCGFENGYAMFFTTDYPEDGHIKIKCPYGQPGDVLWVRENFARFDDGMFAYQCEFKKRYGGWEKDTPKKFHDVERVERWKPNIHMPYSACRQWFKVKNIRCERVQDISDDDAKAEGVLLHERGIHWLNYYDQKGGVTQFIYNLDTAAKSFESLWWVINGKDSWFENPWLWVVEFEKCEKPSTEPAAIHFQTLSTLEGFQFQQP